MYMGSVGARLCVVEKSGTARQRVGFEQSNACG